MFLFVSSPNVKRADVPRAAKSSAVCFCHKFGSVMGLGGGLLVAIAGSLLTGISWLVSNAGAAAVLHQVGGAVLCATIPLLLLGAFCLDGIESLSSEQTKSR